MSSGESPCTSIRVDPARSNPANHSLVATPRSSLVVRNVRISRTRATPRRRSSETNDRVAPPPHCTSSSTTTIGCRCETRSISVTMPSTTANSSWTAIAPDPDDPVRVASAGRTALSRSTMPTVSSASSCSSAPPTYAVSASTHGWSEEARCCSQRPPIATTSATLVMRSASSTARRLLPTPGSPPSRSACGESAAARASSRARSISWMRPTNGNSQSTASDIPVRAGGADGVPRGRLVGADTSSTGSTNRYP